MPEFLNKIEYIFTFKTIERDKDKITTLILDTPKRINLPILEYLLKKPDSVRSLTSQ